MSKDIMAAIVEERESETGERNFEAEDRINSWDYQDDLDEFLSIFGG